VRKPDLHFEEGEYGECEVNGEGFRFVVPASAQRSKPAQEPAHRLVKAQQKAWVHHGRRIAIPVINGHAHTAPLVTGVTVVLVELERRPQAFPSVLQLRHCPTKH
jgi:hypothetical protein